jgi:glycosyltransferase involved in cell wall biosynthesis
MTAGAGIPGADRGGGRLIVRHCGNAHPHICRYLVRQHGFSDLCRLERDPGAKSKIAHVRDMLGDFRFALRHWRRLRGARDLVVIGPMAVGIALLLKLGWLPRCRRLYWFGLFVHSPRWMAFLRPGFRLLDSGRVRYVLFSRFEQSLYAAKLGLSADRLLHVPYGDMGAGQDSVQTHPEPTVPVPARPFFFSGGYSNRDYAALVAVFRTLPQELVIACSSLNRDIDGAGLPPTITVLRDAPSPVFDAYVRRSLACIVPIAHDTGAAGQSCLLRYMSQGKIVIATDTGIIREYLENGVSGILVKDNAAALKQAVLDVAADTAGYRHFGVAARGRFERCFSREATARGLDELVNGAMGENP